MAQHHGRVIEAVVQCEPEAVRVGKLDRCRIGGRNGCSVSCAGGDVGGASRGFIGDLGNQARGNVRQARAGRSRLGGHVCGEHRVRVVQAVQLDRPDVARLYATCQLDVGARVVRVARRLRHGGSGRAAGLRQHRRGHLERVAVNGAVARAADLHVRRARINVDAVADLGVEEGVPVLGRIDVLHRIRSLQDRLRFEDEVRRLVAVDGDLEVVVHAVGQAVRVACERDPVGHLEVVVPGGAELVGEEVVEPGGAPRAAGVEQRR